MRAQEPPLGSVLLIAFGLCLASTRATAQQDDLAEFLTVSEDVASSRRTAGTALLSWGFASVLAGGAVITIDAFDDGLGDAGLASGVTHTSFGVINTFLALGLSGTKAAAEDEDPLDLSHGELKSGQVFALNLGLDVAYIAAGVLMGLGGLELDEPWLEGAGWAMATQGGGLLVFDIWQWLESNDRAASWRAVHESQ